MIPKAFNGPVPFLELTPAARGGWSLYGGRIYARVPATAVYRPDPVDDPNPIDYEASLTLDVKEGRLVCTALTLGSIDGSTPVTSDGIRRIPVGEFIAAAAELGGAFQFNRRVGSAVAVSTTFDPPPKDFAEQGLTDDTLEKISDVYAFCMATGQKPTGVLAREYNLPRPTTSKWIAAARRRGILVDDHRRLPDDYIADHFERMVRTKADRDGR